MDSFAAWTQMMDLSKASKAFHAANKCRTIYAVDASAAMLAYCRKQAEQKGLSNIVYCHSGLLSYEHGAELADARLKQDAIIHVKNEFSTYDWIMEGMIRRSGFHIDMAEYGAGFQTTYLCTKR